MWAHWRPLYSGDQSCSVKRAERCVEGKAADIAKVAINITILWSIIYNDEQAQFPSYTAENARSRQWSWKRGLLNQSLFSNPIIALQNKPQHTTCLPFHCNSASTFRELFFFFKTAAVKLIQWSNPNTYSRGQKQTTHKLHQNTV